jgi:hypothetical protein
MTRRFTPLRLLIAAVILVDALALGSHEVAIHSAACFFGPWRVPQCQVA